VFRDVGQPDLVRTSGREVTLHVVVVNGRPRTLGSSRALGERAEDLLFGADLPHPSFARAKAGVGEFVGNEAIAKDRIVVVHVDRRVG
jgi:hypothetical protein